jgi:hypothetical protein
VIAALGEKGGIGLKLLQQGRTIEDILPQSKRCGPDAHLIVCIDAFGVQQHQMIA